MLKKTVQFSELVKLMQRGSDFYRVRYDGDFYPKYRMKSPGEIIVAEDLDT